MKKYKDTIGATLLILAIFLCAYGASIQWGLTGTLWVSGLITMGYGIGLINWKE